MTFTGALEEEGALLSVLTGSEGVCAGKVEVIHCTTTFFFFFFKSICNTVPSAWQFTVTWQDGEDLTHTEQDQSAMGGAGHNKTQQTEGVCER